MNIDSLLELYRAGEVRRFHTMRLLHPQDIAAHSWGVALVLLWLYGDDVPSAVLLRAAILHDVAEARTGDMRGDVKWGSQTLQNELARIERSFLEAHGIQEPVLSPEERMLLLFADYADGVLFSITELSMGHRRMLEAANRWLIRMADLAPMIGNKRAGYMLGNLKSIIEVL